MVAEPDTIREISQSFIERFETLKPKLVRQDQYSATFSIDLRRLFRSHKRPVLLFLSTHAHLAAAFAEDPDWLDRSWYDDIEGTQGRTDLILFFVRSPGAKETVPKSVARHLERQVIFEGQPLLPLASSLLSSKRDPSAVLKDVILRHAEPRHFSPYRIDEITPTEMFYGRSHLLSELQAAKGSQIIVGPRRIGKSSIARRFQHLLGHVRKFPGVAPDQQMRRCSYVDVSELGQDASSRLWNTILKNFNLQRKDYSAGGRMTKLIRSSRRDDRETLVDEGQALGATISAFHGQLSIVLDEVDKWIESEAAAGWPTLDRLRALSDEGKAQVLLIGYESLALAAENDRFPFAGRGDRLHVGPLDRQGVKTLVMEPLEELGVRLDPEEAVLNRLWQTTSGMPHIVQDICAVLVDLAFHKSGSVKRVITPAMLETAINSSEAVKKLRRGVINASVPLAEAIAGELSFADSQGPPRGSRGASDWAASGQSLSVGAIAKALEETGGYRYDSRDFERALAYLELRFIVTPADGARSRWMWTNDSARKTTRQSIENTGKARWLKNVLERHAEGTWRQRYHLLERPKERP